MVIEQNNTDLELPDETRTLLKGKQSQHSILFFSSKKAEKRLKLFGKASINTTSLLLSAVGSATFTLNAWNLPTTAEGWLGHVLTKLPAPATSIYLAVVTEIVGACMGTSAVNKYIDAAINIRRYPKALLIRVALLLFGIAAMLPASLTAYLDNQANEGSEKLIKNIFLLISTAIYGMVYGNSAYELRHLKLSLNGLELLQRNLIKLANKIKVASDDELKLQLHAALNQVEPKEEASNLDALIDKLLALSGEAQYQVIHFMLKEHKLTPKINASQKQQLFWLASFVIAGITAGGGIIPTWLGMAKFYTNIVGSSYESIATVARLATQGIPSGIAFAARASLYTVAMYHTANRAWDFIEEVVRKKFSRSDVISLALSLMTCVLISLPTSSANIAVVDASRLADYPAVNTILDFVVMPIALIASVILFQMSMNDLTNGIISFCKNYYQRADFAKRKELVDLVNNIANHIENYAVEDMLTDEVRLRA